MQSTHFTSPPLPTDEASTSIVQDFVIGMTVGGMAEVPTNFVGAGIFWLYIVAALYFTGKILQNLATQTSTSDIKRRRETNDESSTAIDHSSAKIINSLISNGSIVFVILALLSFSTLSFNMLQVLIQSFHAWSRVHPNASNSQIIERIWTWSITSTLFQDFALALYQSRSSALWSLAALTNTLGVCVYMGVKGRKHGVPHLWTFFCLSQILPISFSQNLFFLALIRTTESVDLIEASTKVKRKVGLLTWLYNFSLAVPIHDSLPLRGSDVLTVIWLIGLARLSLFVPLLVPLEHNRPLRGGEREPDGLKDSIAQGLQAIVTCVAGLWWRGLSRPSWNDIRESLFDHPAVSSLACDLIISLISTFVFIARLSWIDYRARSRARAGNTEKA